MTHEHPILFSSPMVRAILEDRKTQTRRVMKPQPFPTRNGWYHYDHPGGGSSHWHAETWQQQQGTAPLESWCPYGGPGDLLWVKETWFSPEYRTTGTIPDFKGYYRVDDESTCWDGPWTSSRFMPKWAARLWLQITEVRVQRVQEISKEDARAEGPPDVPNRTWPTVAEYHPIEAFCCLWDSLNAQRGYGWDINPWVFAITFKRIERST